MRLEAAAGGENFNKASNIKIKFTLLLSTNFYKNILFLFFKYKQTPNVPPFSFQSFLSFYTNLFYRKHPTPEIYRLMVCKLLRGVFTHPKRNHCDFAGERGKRG